MTQTGNEYASALFSLALENHSEEEFLNALGFVGKTFEDNPELVELLASPGIPKSERVAVLESVFSKSIPEYVFSFTALLAEKGHIRFFKDYVTEYEKLYNASREISTAVVTSTVELDAGEKQKLKEKLEKLCGHSVVMEYETDSSLLGGLVVRVDGKIIDGSLRYRMRQIREVMDE